MTSREQFEAWAPNYCWKYSTTKELAWLAWQASREAMEVELPSLKQIDSGERYVWSDGVFNFKEDVIESLIATGIKVKGE